MFAAPDPLFSTSKVTNVCKLPSVIDKLIITGFKFIAPAKYKCDKPGKNLAQLPIKLYDPTAPYYF